MTEKATKEQATEIEVTREEAVAPFVVALDIGTSSARAAVYDGRAVIVKGTQARLAHRFQTTTDGGAELDAEELVGRAVTVIAESLALFDKAKEEHGRRSEQVVGADELICAVAVSCFWHSLIGVDINGVATTPVFGWADTRAASAASDLRRTFDEQQTHNRTGCRFHASYWTAKLAWLKQARPEVWRDTKRWLSFAEFLTLRLFGETEMSVSNASATGLFDVRRLVWDTELTGWLGLVEDQLPKLADEHRSFNGLKDDYAATLPKLRDAAWFPAIGDGAANNIGAGCTTKERAAIMIGTSGAMRVLYAGDVPAELPPALWCYRLDRKRVVTGGALSDGGGLYSWMINSLALPAEHPETSTRAVEVADEIEDRVALLPPDAHGLTVLPFWAGERSTGWAANARGAILGFTMDTTAHEILRAAMEAVAYRFASVAHALESFTTLKTIYASGGALRESQVWTQILCDVLNRPVQLIDVHEASSRGAVLLALERLGKIKTIGDGEVALEEIFQPNQQHHEVYKRGHDRQQRIYEALIANDEIAKLVAQT